MENTQILLPLFILGFWTFGVLLIIPYVRIKAANTGNAKRDDFKFGESDNLPDWVKLPNRNYMNLLELPLLFYILGIIIFITNISSPILIALSWLYVILRMAHSIIHIGFNNIMLRLAAFAISNFVLLAMWIISAIAIF